MNFNRGALKADARAAIRDSRTSPYLIALVLIAISYVLNYFQARLTGVTLNYDALLRAAENGTYYDYVLSQAAAQMPGGYETFIGILLTVMSVMLNVGYVISTLRVARRQDNVVGNLFDGFGMFFRVLWLEILIWFFTFLWSLLFVIPGIIAAYRYRQALYLLIDNPEMSALDCISESKRLMTGHKTELFFMDLSFLGWYILCAVPFVPIYVFPYTYTSYALYYDRLIAPDASERPDGRTSGDGAPPWEL